MTKLSLPVLSLTASNKKSWSIPSDFLGKWTLLYFYPKDDTTGCTVQACAYRDQKKDWEKSGIQVLGVSMDDLNSHDSFARKFELNFPLLADTEKKLATALNVYGEQEWQGKKYMGLSRDSFLINPKGEIIKEWRKVDPKTTVTETLKEAITQMNS